MKVYQYNADLLCGPCGRTVRDRLHADGKAPADPTDEATYDSADYPKGPYSDGGGEADCPQHCSTCLLFLENPLTDEGRQYVQDMISDFREFGGGDEDAIGAWMMFYGIT